MTSASGFGAGASDPHAAKTTSARTMWNSRSNLHYLIKIYGDPEAFRQRQLERSLTMIVDKIKTKKILLNVHPFVASFLTKGFIPIFRKWNFKYHINLKIQAVTSYYVLEYHFYDPDGNEIDQAL
jgi:hypothetical protein